MALSHNLKHRLGVSLAEPAARDELVDAVEGSQADVSALEDQVGDLEDRVAENVVDADTDTVADIAISTSGGNTYSDADVNTAVNAAILEVNDAVEELQDQLNACLAALKAAGLMVDDS
jgi:hypothetical protein